MSPLQKVIPKNKRKKKRVSAPHWCRADWSGRRLCLERSDLTRRDSLHPDALIKCHLSPTLSHVFLLNLHVLCLSLKWNQRHMGQLPCQAGALAGQWGYTKLCFSWQSFLFLPSCPITHKNRLLDPGSGGCVFVCRAMTGYVLMVDHERWGTGTCLCRWFHSLPREKTKKKLLLSLSLWLKNIYTGEFFL